MSGSNDPQLQALLLQMRGQQRRPSAQSRLAEQMMASLNNPAPVYSTGAGLARVGSGILAGLMSGMAERDERAREEQQLRDLQERTDARDAQQTQRIGAILAGAGFGNMFGAPQAPPQAPQMAPQAPMPMGAEAGAAATEAALPPGQPRFNPSTARNVVDEDGRDWDPALRGRPWDAGLRPPTGRVMPLNPEAVPPPRPGVLLPGMAGAAPTPAPGGGGRNYDAAALALAMTPGGERLAPIISQMGQRADRTFPTVEINGPQGPGTYERTPQGLRFLGARMPPQEAPDETERLIRQAGLQPGSPEAQAAARDILARRGTAPSTNVNVNNPQVGTIPPGFQLTRGEDGSMRMEPIPGGPAATAAERQTRADNASDTGRRRTGNVVLQDIDRVISLLDRSTLPVAGTGATTMAGIPGTASSDVRSLLDTIRANVGFAQLNQMRAESPTGGALGQVTERELALLQAVLGSLDQSQTPTQFRRNLLRLQEVYKEIIDGPQQAQGPLPGSTATPPTNRPPLSSFGR